MKIVLLALLSFFYLNIFSQVATSDPSLPFDTDELTITFDVSKGSGTLAGYTGDVYVHTGVLISSSLSSKDWKYVLTSWGENTANTKLTRIGTDLYQYTISPSIREFYGVPSGTVITDVAFVLRSGVKVDGSYLECKDDGGSDIFVKVFESGFNLAIVRPLSTSVSEKNQDIIVNAGTTSMAHISLFVNDSLVKTNQDLTLIDTLNFQQSGDYWIKFTADDGNEVLTDSVFVHILANEIYKQIPAGIKDGFNELTPNSGILKLYAPYKDYVFVIGEFNNWTPSSEYRMNFYENNYWLEIDNLEPGKEYAYQYYVDGELTIADPFTEKVLDPWNDGYISGSTYPDLKDYPQGNVSGIVSVLQTQKPTYEWSGVEFEAPDQSNLVIYELLLRDFIAAHDWKTLTDTLNYFSKLGVTAIELMPFNEFEGNSSWGYNPSFYFAPDKYYGPENDLKEFIDSCHNRGIAVIMDIVLNHSFGQSPMVQLYWNDALDQPAANSPWYNETSPNSTYSWGYDFNHESYDTKKFIDKVNRYWMNEYKIDGYRFDFTKGFTNTSGDGGAYDAYRINILERMADSLWAVHPDAYMILEHFADNSEEKELSNHGLMLWGNLNYNYNEATMGFNENNKSNFGGISYLSRGWNDPHLVGYMESHDEERLSYKNISYGNSYEDYNIKDPETSSARIELAAVFFIPIPGPKMIWQFGEMAYDWSIDYNDRVGEKPIRWDYLNSHQRLYRVFSELNHLKKTEPAFQTTDFTLNLSGALKRIEMNHADMDVRIIGNFDVKSGAVSANFSHTGTWYEYFTGDSVEVTSLSDEISLEAGEYRLYTTKKFNITPLPTGIKENVRVTNKFLMYPNPATDYVYIESTDRINEIQIFDLSGRLVSSRKADAYTTELDTSGIAKGIYLVCVEAENESKQLSKLVLE